MFGGIQPHLDVRWRAGCYQLGSPSLALALERSVLKTVSCYPGLGWSAIKYESRQRNQRSSSLNQLLPGHLHKAPHLMYRSPAQEQSAQTVFMKQLRRSLTLLSCHPWTHGPICALSKHSCHHLGTALHAQCGSSAQFSLFTAICLAYRRQYIMSAALAAITEPKPTRGPSESKSQLPFFTRLLSHAAAYRPDSVTQVCGMASALAASISHPPMCVHAWVCRCVCVCLPHSNSGITSAIQKIGID